MDEYEELKRQKWVTMAPNDGAERVPIDTTIVITFEKDVDATSTKDTIELVANGTPITVIQQVQGQTVTLTPTHSLLYNFDYTVNIYPDLKATNGYTFDRTLALTFSTETPPLSVVGIYPARLASEASTNTPIILTFSEPIASTSAEGAIDVITNDSRITGTLSFPQDTQIRFTPDDPFPLGASVMVTAKTKISTKDGSGTLAQEFFSLFSVDPNPDIIAPKVIEAVPVADQTSVPIESFIGIQFSEGMDTEATEQAFRLRNATGNDVAGEFIWEGDMLLFVPSALLNVHESYRVIVTTFARDCSGLNLEEALIYTFRTADSADTENPSIVSHFPLDGQTDVSPSAPIIVTFSEVMDRITTPQHVQLYKGNPNQAELVEGTIGWQGSQLFFYPTYDLTYNTEYTFVIGKNAADPAGNILGVGYGFSFTSNTTSDTTPPGFDSISVEAVEEEKARFTWELTEPAFVTLELSTQSNFNSVLYTTKNIEASYYNHIGLQPATTYYYRLSAMDYAYNKSDSYPSSPGTFTTTTPQTGTPPQMLSASVDNITDKGATFIWETDSWAQMTLELSTQSTFASLTELVENYLGNSYVSYDLNAQTTYYYRLTPASYDNLTGDPYPVPAGEFTTLADTTPPTYGAPSLLASISPSYAITLDWTNPKWDPDFSYMMLRRKSNEYPASVSDGTSIYTGNKETTTEVDPGDGNWYYSLFACDAQDNCRTKGTKTQVNLCHTPGAFEITGNTITNNPNPTLSWTEPTYGDTYELTIYGNTSCSGSVIQSKSNVTTTSWIVESALPDGTYCVQVKAYNTQVIPGCSSFADQSFVFTVDTLPATAILLNLPPSTTNSTNILVGVQASDALTYKYDIDGGGYSSERSIIQQLFLEDLTEGEHTLSVITKDNAGNWQDPEDAQSYTWTIDLTPPSITLTNTPSIQTNSTSIAISVTGSDASAYQYQLDGGGWSSDIPLATPISETGLSAGAHTLLVRARDTVGNYQASPTIFSWNIDTTPPLAILTQLPAATSNRTETNIVVTGTDVTYYKVKFDGGTWSSETAVATAIIHTLSSGSHTVQVVGRDAAGNWQADGSATSYTWEIDTGVVEAVLSNLPDRYSNQTSFTINVGGTQVVSYQYQLNGGGWSAETPIGTPISLGPLGESNYTLEVVGKRDTPSIVWQDVASATTYSFEVDTTPPDAQFLSTPDNPTNQTSASILVGGIDVVCFQYQLNTGSWIPIPNTATPIALSNLLEGTQTVRIRGIDAAGNMETIPSAASYSWNIDRTPPTAVLSGTPASHTNDTSATITVGGTDVTAYTYRLNGGNWSDTIPIATPISETGLSEGLISLEVLGMDAVGNWQAVEDATLFNWQVDLTAPSFSLSNLPPTYVNDDSINVVVTGTEVSHYHYYIDTLPFSTDINVAFPIAESGLSDGEHTLVVESRDLAGNWATAQSFTWEIDATPPTTILSNLPESGSTTSINITVSGTDVVAYKYKVGALGFYSPEYSVSQPIVHHDLMPGMYELYVIGRDEAGNWEPGTVPSHTWTISCDAVTLTDEPVSPAVGSSATYTWDALSGVSQYKIEYAVGPGFSSWVPLTTTSSTTFTWNTGFVPATPYRIRITPILSDGCSDPTEGIYTIVFSDPILYVDQAQSDDTQSGCLPSEPKKTIGAAVTIATANPYFTTIKVKAGTYAEPLAITTDVSIQGGYDDTTYSEGARTMGSSMLTYPATTVISYSGLSQPVTLKGFTIQNTISGSPGTAVDITSSQLTIDHCTIDTVSGTERTAVAISGGNLSFNQSDIDFSALGTASQNVYGIYASNASVTISNSTIDTGSTNTSSTNYGVYGISDAGAISIESSQIQTGGGGTCIGIACENAGETCTITNMNTVIVGNATTAAYGIKLNGNVTGSITTGNSITAGNADDESFGVYVTSNSTSPVIQGNTSIQSGNVTNTTTGISAGVYIDDANVTIDSNDFIGTGYGPTTGNAYAAGIAGDAVSNTITISNNTEISGGSAAPLGGRSYGIRLDNGSVDILDNTLIRANGASIENMAIFLNGTLTYNIARNIVDTLGYSTGAASAHDELGIKIINSTNTVTVNRNTITIGDVTSGSGTCSTVGLHLTVASNGAVCKNNVIETGPVDSTSGSNTNYGIHIQAGEPILSNNTVITDAANNGAMAIMHYEGSSTPLITNNMLVARGTFTGTYTVLYDETSGTPAISFEHNGIWKATTQVLNSYYDGATFKGPLHEMENFEPFFVNNVQLPDEGTGDPFQNFGNSSFELAQNTLVSGIFWHIVNGGKDTSANVCGDGSQSCGNVTVDILGTTRTADPGFSIGAYESSSSVTPGLGEGLELYYTFSGNADDQIGSNNGNTSSAGSLVTDRFSNSNAAYTYDGMSNYIYSTSDLTISGAAPRTLSIWLKSNTATPFDKMPAAIWGNYATPDTAFGIGTNAFSPYNVEGQFGAGSNLDSTQAMPTDWEHWVLTYDGSWLKIYRNGTIANSSSKTLNTTTDQLHLGADPTHISNFWEGDLDDVRVYDRPLSPYEIQMLYDMEVVCMPAQPTSYDCP